MKGYNTSETATCLVIDADRSLAEDSLVGLLDEKRWWLAWLLARFVIGGGTRGKLTIGMVEHLAMRPVSAHMEEKSSALEGMEGASGAVGQNGDVAIRR